MLYSHIAVYLFCIIYHYNFIYRIIKNIKNLYLYIWGVNVSQKTNDINSNVIKIIDNNGKILFEKTNINNNITIIVTSS